jgi:ankyrin repeat protein
LTESKGNDALQFAVYGGHLSVVKALLENGAMPNRKNQNGILPLHMAIYRNNSSMATLLLSMGASPNITALLNPMTASMFQKNDSNRDAIDKIISGQVEISSLMFATQHGNVEIVKDLLAKGANVYFKNSIDGSALSYAINFKHKDIENLLVQAGASK